MENTKTQKALFLLHEGIGSTIFNSQVAEHVSAMKKYNIDFDILSFDTWKKTWNTSNKNLQKFKKSYPNTNVYLKKGVNIFFPIIHLYNIILFITFIHSNRKKYAFIHARADYSAFIGILTKPIHKIPVIWDCRGDSLDELYDSLSRKNFLTKYLGIIYLATSMKMRLLINAKFADRAIFVSDALKNHYIKQLKTPNFKIIPCPVAETKFFFDEKLRISQRKNLNFKENEVIYMYSGSMIGYQYIDGLKLIFENILQEKNNFILIVTTETTKAREIFKFLPKDKVLIFESSFNDMSSFYNAADFGILLREPKKLNFVASPTKFGEYSLAGLPVIMNDTVDQCYNYSKIIGNYIFHRKIPSNTFKIEQRKEIAEKSKKLYARKELNQLYLELYQF